MFSYIVNTASPVEILSPESVSYFSSFKLTGIPVSYAAFDLSVKSITCPSVTVSSILNVFSYTFKSNVLTSNIPKR